MLLRGYYLETTEINVVQEYLGEMKRVIMIKSKELYKELLRHEIEMVVDYTALNAIQQPNVHFLDAAEGMLLSRMRFASLNNLPTKFNFNVSAHVFPFEGKTYIKINTQNDDFVNALKGVNDLHPCHVTNSSDPLKNNGELWEKIMRFYKGGTPMFGVQLLSWDKPEDINYKGIRFHTPKQRAEDHARYNMENRLLNMLGNGEQIPGYRLMEFMDDALIALGTKDSKEELTVLKGKLLGILPNITYEFVSTNPKLPGDSDKTETENDNFNDKNVSHETSDACKRNAVEE